MAMDLYSAATMKAMSGIMQTQDAQYADAGHHDDEEGAVTGLPD